MSDRERSRARRSKSRERRRDRYRDRTPAGGFRRTMEAMLERLTALEDRSFVRPSRSHERYTPARSPRRTSSPSRRRNLSPLQVSSLPAPTCATTPTTTRPAPLVRAPSQPLVATPPPPPSEMVTTSELSHAADGAVAPSTTVVSTEADRIVDAIRTIGKSVRSNQAYYISNFDPSLHNIDDWCDEVDRARTLNSWSNHECLSRVGNCLKGDARTWLNEWVTNDRSWHNFKKEFKPLCPKTPDIANILFEVMNTNSDRYPTYAEYVRRSLLRLRIVRGLSDELTVAIIIRGITDPQIRATATNAKLSPDNLVEFFAIYVKSESSKTLSTSKQDASGKSKIDSAFTRKRKFQEGRCFICGMSGHRQSSCNKKTKTGLGVGSLTNDVSNTSSKPNFVPSKPEPCSYCKKPGHKIDSCFAKQKSESRNQNNVNFCREGRVPHNSDVVVAVVQGIPIDVLIDSGSTISLISSSLVKHFACASIKPAFRVLKGLGSQEIESTSCVTLPIEFDGLTLEVDLYVVGSEFMNTPVIVGTDVLNRDGVRYVRTRDFQRLTREVVKSDVVMTVQSDLKIPINTPLVGDQLERLMVTINEFSEHLISGTATSTVNTGSMSIKLNSDTPVNYRPYRLSHAETLRVRDIVQDLLDKGIIEESESDYASPILLVKKKDGSDRMCVDYRKLNELTVKCRFPLPRIDDHIDRLGQNKYFTSLDMATGFHQIPLEKDSVHLTAFVTPEAHYQYKKTPYGLANAPVVFQRIITKTLRDFIESGEVLVYIDDVLILSKTVDRGLELLNQVLSVLTKAGFSLNLRKCSFLTTEIEYLGRYISQGQVRPSHDKVKALTETSEPKNVKQVRQFLGLASYFRKYIAGFAQKTACLAALTRKGVEFNWGAAQQAARKDIIECLTSEPVLTIYDPSLPIEVHTDASSIGYGAVLFQIHEGGHKRVVAYFSKLTHGAENKYHSYELETLAVVRALEHFRHYLVGIHFTVVTDCNALKLTKRKKDLLPRVARWWVYLQDFDFDLDYRKGTLLAHADYLSRNPVNVCTVQKPLNWAQIAQASDGETQALIQALADGQLDANRYTVRNDLLYAKYVPTGEPARQLCFIPKGHRLSLLRIFHDDHEHPGVDKTVDLILKHFWFPGVKGFARKYIEHCLVCLSHKKVARAPLQPIHSWEKPDAPFETIHMDTLGPLVESDGYRHVLIIVDAFSKYCLLYPMYRQDANELKRHVTNAISLFGTPKLIVGDRGRMFQSTEFLSWIKDMGCEVHLITPEMHQSNGQVERYCRTLLNMIRIECNYRQEQWPRVMWKLQLVLNITKHKTTQYSALNLLVGIDAATPLIRSLVRDVALEGLSPNREALREMNRQRTSERLRKNQLSQDVYVNQRRKSPRSFELNSFVFVRKQTQSTGKLDSGMRGPYRVTKVLPHGRYELQLLAGSYGKSTQAAAEYIIPWRGEWTPEVCAAFCCDADTDDEGEESTPAAAVDVPMRDDEPRSASVRLSASDAPQPGTSGLQTSAAARAHSLHEDQPEMGVSMPMLETDLQS